MKLLAVALVAALLLAGCASKKDDGEGDGASGTSSSTGTAGPKPGTATSSGTRSGSASGTGTGAPANQAPVATLGASRLNGTVPVTVNFTLNATDANGDALAWTLAFGDGTQANGTAAGKLGSVVAHAYTAAGNHTAVLTVSDGKGNGTANVTVRVAASASAPLVSVKKTVVFGCEACTAADGAAVPCVSLAVDTSGGDCAWVSLDPAMAGGRTFSVSAASSSPAPPPLNGANPDIAVLGACTPDAPVLLFQSGDNDVETGVLPAGAACLVAWDYDETWVNIELVFFVA